jgi:glycerol-3-phosphate acyltransferase PlsX
LCGNGEEIAQVLDRLEREIPFDRSELVIEHCAELVPLEESPSLVWRNHPTSSIVRCVALQKEGVVQGSISAGNTGILIGAALFILGRSDERISRPALAAFIPSAKRKPVLLLDVGGNVNCRAEHLITFASLGSSYAGKVLTAEVPSVALLNIGQEKTKGPQEVKDAADVLERDLAGYAGFIEGNRVLAGDVDVVVCDGFSGNILLKAFESFYALAARVLDDQPEMMKLLSGKMEVLNAENYGAVPFLGVNGTVLKAHGGSSSRAIRNAVLTALRAVHSTALPGAFDLKG